MAGVDVAAFRRVLADAVETRVASFGERTAGLYEQAAPRDEGTLASAFRWDITTAGDRVRLHGEVDDQAAPHGKWIDQPVDEIVPVRARALHWFAQGGGDVFAKRVVPSRAHEGWWQRFVDLAVADAIER